MSCNVSGFYLLAFVQLIVIVQLLNSTRSSAIADKAPNASCQNYIHWTLLNSNHIQIERHVAIAIPSRSNAMLSLVAQWVSYISHIIKTVPQFSVYSHSDNNESKVIRILAFLCDALLVLCLSFCPYSLVALNCERYADQAFHQTFDSDAQLEPVQQHYIISQQQQNWAVSS